MIYPIKNLNNLNISKILIYQYTIYKYNLIISQYQNIYFYIIIYSNINFIPPIRKI